MSTFNQTAAVKIQDCNSQLISRLDDGFELLELVDSPEAGSVDFIFLEVNPAYERLTGLKAANIIGKRKQEVVPFAEQRWYDYALQALRSGKTFHYEYFNAIVTRFLETQFIPISTNDIAVLFKDVTERKKNETALKESEEKEKI